MRATLDAPSPSPFSQLIAFPWRILPSCNHVSSQAVASLADGVCCLCLRSPRASAFFHQNHDHNETPDYNDHNDETPDYDDHNNDHDQPWIFNRERNLHFSERLL